MKGREEMSAKAPLCSGEFLILLYISWGSSVPPTCSHLNPLHSDYACLSALSTPCSSWALWCCTSVARNSTWLPWSSPWHWAGLTCCTTPVASSRWAFTLSWSQRSVQWVRSEASRVFRSGKCCQRPHFQEKSHQIYLHGVTGESHVGLLHLAFIFWVKWSS